MIRDIINSNSGVNDVRFFATGDLGFGGIRYWNDNGDATYNATIAASGLGNIDPYAFNPNAETNNSYPELPRIPGRSRRKPTRPMCRARSSSTELAIPISGTLGVRYVDTDTMSSGYNRFRTAPVSSTFPRASVRVATPNGCLR